MLPRDTNARGTIFGGVILSHIDLAGAVAASRQSQRNFVTIKVDVEAERSKEPAKHVKVTEAEVIYVAVDEAGTPITLK
jgi:acyl-CoA thioesterase YciA